MEANRFDDARERAAQEERRRILHDNREMKKQRAIETRRKIIIGEIVMKYFPDVVCFQPKLRHADTDAEFAALEYFVSQLAHNQKIASLFQKIISQKA